MTLAELSKRGAGCICDMTFAIATNAEVIEQALRQLAAAEGMSPIREVRFFTRLRSIGIVAVVNGENESMVVAGGTTAVKGDRVVDGWLDVNASAAAGGFNTTSWKDANDVMSALNRAVTLGNELILYGYSAGGMLVEAIAKQFQLLGRTRIRHIITYGAPKPAFAGHCFTDPRCDRIRWMRHADPVPELPFQTPIGACWRFFTAFTAASQPWKYQHGRGGAELYGTGAVVQTRPNRVVFRDEPTGASTITILQVADWLTKSQESNSNPHAIRDYFGDLSGTVQDIPDDVFRRSLGGARTANVPFDAEDIVQAVQQLPNREQPRPGSTNAVQIIGNRLSLPSGVQVPVVLSGEQAMPQARIRSDVRAEGMRNGTAFVVLWMNRPVALCPTISKARVIARRINSMLRALGNTDVVYGVAIDQSLNDFLTAAAIGNGSVVPPLNVE